MLSRKEVDFSHSKNSVVCYDDISSAIKFKINTAWVKHPYKKDRGIWAGEYYFLSKEGEWTINDKKGITTPLIQAPHGGYCHDCIKTQYEKDQALMNDDLTVRKFWTYCKECKIRSNRSETSRKWTNKIKHIDPHLTNTRFITLTNHELSSKRWKMQTIFDNFAYEYDFNKKEDFEKFIKIFSRKYTRVNDDGSLFTGYKGLFKISDYQVLEEYSKQARKKLVNRLRKLRHNKNNKKSKRFQSKVQGGIYCYECVINLHPDSKEVSLHPHLHGIIFGSYYEQSELKEDWGKGMVRINQVTDPWKVSLEVTKYVGKDGKRYAWGKLREVKKA